MKRIFSVLLIALLLVCPLMPAFADAGDYIRVPEGWLTEEEEAQLEARAKDILLTRGVALYFRYVNEDTDASALIDSAESFLAEEIPESNALLLALNTKYYYFAKKGVTAEELFTEQVCDNTIWEAYRLITDDFAFKIQSYLESADQQLALLDRGIALTDAGKPTVVDRAQLLTDAEASLLSERLKELGSEYRCDIVVVTVDDLGDTDTTEYADDFFDYNGYGYGALPDETGMTVDGDGILLLIALAQREYCLSTSGSAIEIFDDAELDALAERFVDKLSADEYADAFFAFTDGCETILKDGSLQTPEPSPDPTPEPTPMPPVTYLKSGKLPVVDMARLLSADEVTALSEKLAAIAERYQCDIVIVTADGLGSKTATEYADDFFDYNGYGYGAVPDANGVTVNGDGILLLVSMEERDYAISTSGFGITALTDYGISDLEDRFLPDLSRGDYAESFNTFADRCDWLLNTARKGRPYDVGYYLNVFTLVVAIIAGLLLAFIPVSAMKRQLTDVKKNTNADRYLTPQTFVMTQNSDVFLNSHVTRTVHVEPQRSSGGGGHSGGSSTHTSSSGGTHGGHSGKF